MMRLSDKQNSSSTSFLASNSSATISSYGHRFYTADGLTDPGNASAFHSWVRSQDVKR